MGNFYYKLNSFYLLLVFLIFSQTTFSQENDSAINELLIQRSGLISSGSSTTATDLQLFGLGHRPKAVLDIQTLAGGILEVHCPLYRSYSPENIQGMFQRLASPYPYLLSLEKGSDGVSLKGIFQSGTTAAQIAEVTNHFGYHGYETQD